MVSDPCPPIGTLHRLPVVELQVAHFHSRSLLLPANVEGLPLPLPPFRTDPVHRRCEQTMRWSQHGSLGFLRFLDLLDF